MIARDSVSLTINGKAYTFSIGEGGGQIPSSQTLAETLRGMLLLTGTKTPCNKGACGGCTVLVNGTPTLACSNLTVECGGKDVVTVEGLKDPVTGALHPVQQAFIDIDAIQCGMCTPGMVISGVALLRKNHHPTREEVAEAISGNICRCTGYVKYIDGILLAAERMYGEEKE